MFALGEHQAQWLAEHLGHSMAVHHQHYRLPSSTLEKAKVAKLLMAVDSGKSSNFVGRTLDEISLDEIGMFTEVKTAMRWLGCINKSPHVGEQNYCTTIVYV